MSTVKRCPECGYTYWAGINDTGTCVETEGTGCWAAAQGMPAKKSWANTGLTTGGTHVEK